MVSDHFCPKHMFQMLDHEIRELQNTAVEGGFLNFIDKCYQKCGCLAALLGYLVEMQILRPHQKPTEPEALGWWGKVSAGLLALQVLKATQSENEYYRVKN